MRADCLLISKFSKARHHYLRPWRHPNFLHLPRSHWRNLVQNISFSLLESFLLDVQQQEEGKTLITVMRSELSLSLWLEVRRICRTSIRAPPKLGPRQSIRLRDNTSLAGRSPRLQRRVNSLTNDDVISFTFSNYDADVDDNEKEHSAARYGEQVSPHLHFFGF